MENSSGAQHPQTAHTQNRPSDPLPSQNRQQPVAQPQQAVAFTSQPFAAAMKGLGKLASVNPISALTVPFIAVLAFVIVAIMTGVLTALTSGSVAATIIATLIPIIAFLLIALRASAASIVLLNASYDGRQLTGRYALGKGSSSQLTRFVLTGLLAGLFVLIGFIALILPGIFLAVRFSLVGFVVYDEGIGYMAAIKRSWKLTKGHFFEVFSALIAQGIITGNGLLSFTGSMTGAANRYHELKAAEKTNTPTGKTHWLNFLLPIGVLIVGVIYVAVFALSARSTTQRIDYGECGYGCFPQSTGVNDFQYPSSSDLNDPNFDSGRLDSYFNN